MQDFPSREIIARLKEQYPVGCRVRLNHMSDPYRSLPGGSEGTVRCVDDAGTIHVNWDCGSSLGVCYGEDSCSKITEQKQKKTTSKKYMYAMGSFRGYNPQNSGTFFAPTYLAAVKMLVKPLPDVKIEERPYEQLTELQDTNQYIVIVKGPRQKKLFLLTR